MEKVVVRLQNEILLLSNGDDYSRLAVYAHDPLQALGLVWDLGNKLGQHGWWQLLPEKLPTYPCRNWVGRFYLYSDHGVEP